MPSPRLTPRATTLVLALALALLSPPPAAAGGTDCTSLGLKLQSGPCAPLASAIASLKPSDITDIMTEDCAARAKRAAASPLSAACCADVAAFAAAGCACDARTLALAELAGVSRSEASAAVALATAACPAREVKVVDACAKGKTGGVVC